MTTGEAAQAQNDTAQNAVLPHGIERVLRTGGMKAASQPPWTKEAGENGRDHRSINS
jgi:hypothetical protein